MKLDKTLNFKKVRCVKGYDDCLEIGKEYNVIDISVEIKVKDDEGKFLYWESDHFEPVLDSAENALQGVELTPEFEAVEPVLVDNRQVNIQDIGTDILDTNTDIKDTPKFKVGDKVYYGSEPDVLTILEFDVDGWARMDSWAGFVDSSRLCQATPENYERLQATFPDIEFEQPPKPLSGDALVKAMLAKGIKNVLCLWGNGDKIIIDRLSYKGGLMSTNCNIVGGLTPIDWYTGEPLTEAVLDE